MPIGTSPDQWLEALSALLAGVPLSHPAVAELMVNPNLPGAGNQAIAWA